MKESEPERLPLYYRYTAPKLFSDISLHVRKEVFQKFMGMLRPGPSDTVLDIGATKVGGRQESNFFEQFYPYPQSVTAVGVEDVSGLQSLYPAMRFIQIEEDQPLPFRDQEFDLAFSNAVLEHVGDHHRQLRFVGEVTRVSKRGMIAIPDRRFPVEYHSSIPFIHWLPGKVHRTIFGMLGFTELQSEENLHLLWRREFRSLFVSKAPRSNGRRASDRVTIQPHGILLVWILMEIIAPSSESDLVCRGPLPPPPPRSRAGRAQPSRTLWTPVPRTEALGKSGFAGVDPALSAARSRSVSRGGRPSARASWSRTVRHLQDTYHTTLEALGSAIETRDMGVPRRSRRVRGYSLAIARAHGVPEGELRDVASYRSSSLIGAASKGL